MSTSVSLGSGEFIYAPQEGWAQLPDGWSFKECADVAVDTNDRVYVFNRGEHPVIVFEADGSFVGSWGEGIFTTAHGITYAPNDTMYMVDQKDHSVRRCALDGRVVSTIGVPHEPSTRWSGHAFNEPTKVAVSPKNGDLFISDGYGNSRVHKYSPDGRHLFSWGGPGIDPGEFVIPHTILVDNNDNVIVGDRECNRVQIFDTKGKLQHIWQNIWKPAGMALGPDGNLYIAELCGDSYFADAPNVGNRVSVYTVDGKLLARLGMPTQGEGPDSSSQPTASPSTPAGTFMWPRYPGQWSPGTLKTPGRCAACKSWSGSQGRRPASMDLHAPALPTLLKEERTTWDS